MEDILELEKAIDAVIDEVFQPMPMLGFDKLLRPYIVDFFDVGGCPNDSVVSATRRKK